MKFETLKIEHEIKKSDEKKFLRLPLQIPDNVETIEIKPGYTGDEANANVTDREKNVIDFALLDENGDDLGSSGSNIRKITISKSFASDGYKRREPKGTWQILIGCFQVKTSGSTVHYEIKFIFKEFRYLKGDIHSHTTNSDGKYTYEELCKKAKAKGLDFLFITDHNNSTEDMAIPPVAGLTVIEGLELTSYDGHINLLGVKKPYDGSYAVGSIDELNEKLRQSKERGAMRVVNHPFCFMCGMLWDIDKLDYDGVEIWNGPAVSKEMKALAWWQKKLEEGKHIPVTGGSDYHKDYFVTDLLAMPTTRVWCDSNDKETILNAVKAGRCVITNGPESTMIDIRCGESTAGDTVIIKDKAELIIHVTGMKKGHTLQVFNQTGLVYEYRYSGKADFTYTMDVHESGFIRAQIIYNKKLLGRLLHKAVLRTLSKAESKKPIPALVYALTNPVYFEKM